MKLSKKTVFKPALGYENHALAYCLVQIAEQRQLLQHVRSLLPQNIAENIVHCLRNRQRLTIYATSSAWASQLRFYQDTLLDLPTGIASGKIDKVHIKILPPWRDGSPLRRARLPSIDTIAALAPYSPADSGDELTQAMSRLMTTLKSKAEQQTE